MKPRIEESGIFQKLFRHITSVRMEKPTNYVLLFFLAVMLGLGGTRGYSEELEERSVTGKIQGLFMGRKDKNTKEAQAGSLALTLNVENDLSDNLKVGFQYIHSLELYSGGSYQGEEGSSYYLQNSDYSLLNNAYLQYHFPSFEMYRNYVTLGRQTLDLSFITPATFRQKEQAFEGVVFTSKKIVDEKEKSSLDIGHLKKVSGFTSRNKQRSFPGNTSEFVSIEQAQGLDSSRGIYFFEWKVRGDEGDCLKVYDYYSPVLYNTIGLRGDRKILDRDDFQLRLKTHYIHQKSQEHYFREYGKRFKINALQVGIDFSFENFRVESGIFKLLSSSKGSRLQSLFHPAHLVSDPVYGNDYMKEEGGVTYYLQGSYRFNDRHRFWFYGAQTNYQPDSIRVEHNREFNLVFNNQIAKQVSVKISLYYLTDTGEENRVYGSRVFMEYSF